MGDAHIQTRSHSAPDSYTGCYYCSIINIGGTRKLLSDQICRVGSWLSFVNRVDRTLIVGERILYPRNETELRDTAMPSSIDSTRSVTYTIWYIIHQAVIASY